MLTSLLLTGAVQAGELVVTVLDVGQGDAILLETSGGSRVLVDTGLARAQTAAQLRAFGVDHLDLVVASHPHADHVGAMGEVLTELPADRFWYSGMHHTTQAWGDVLEALEASGTEPEAVKRGDQLELDGVTLQVLWPEEPLLENTRSDLNANSVVLRVDHEDDCLLLTGDAEAITEGRLMRQGLDSCEALKVAHHGSRHSTSQGFVAAVQPELALISLGADNRYGHPGEETMARLRGQGATVYRTDLTGVIQLSSDGHGWEVTDGLPWDAPVDPALVVLGPVEPEARGLRALFPGLFRRGSRSPDG